MACLVAQLLFQLALAADVTNDDGGAPLPAAAIF